MGMLIRSLFAVLLLLFASAAPLPGHPDGAGAAWAQSEAAQPRTNDQIRKWYNEQTATIPVLNAQWTAEGLSAEERARKAHEIRHAARIKAREFMQSKDEVKLLQDRDLQVYGNPDGPTFDQLVAKNQEKGLQGDAVYEAIVGSSNRTNKDYNEKYGVRPQPQAP